ncbi:MAG: hypothetical protein LBK70_02405 [Clostridiales bacterium]|jgi:hypothetical protein|nr:hypothetical protein [Clostridiales bacterium]
MGKYQVDISSTQQEIALRKANSLGLDVQDYIVQIVHNHLDALHSMKEEDFERAYSDSKYLEISDF